MNTNLAPSQPPPQDISPAHRDQDAALAIDAGLRDAKANRPIGHTRTSWTAPYRGLIALTAILLICTTACSDTQTTPTRQTQPGTESSARPANLKKALELTPWTTNVLFVMDVKRLRDEADLDPELWRSFANSLRNAIDRRFNTDEITPEEVDLFVYAASTIGYDKGAVLLQGDFHPEDVRQKWQDEDYDQRTYRNQELWTGRDTYAIIETHKSVIASSHETLVKDFARVHDGTITSLHRLRDTHYAQLLAVLRDAPMYFASGHGADCAHRLEDCQAFGIRFERSESDRNVIHVAVALVIADPPAAAEAADEHTDAVDAATYILDAHTSWAGSILLMPPRLEAELGNVRVEDNVLYVEAALLLEGSQ